MHFRKRADSVNNTTPLPPAPKTVAPSGSFDGNDGDWSTFLINVGDSDGTGGGQNFKVLISTSSPIVLVPAQADWCDEDCAKDRGVQVYKGEQNLGFQTTSSSWSQAGIYDLPVPDGWLNKTDKPRGTWGTDNVGLGPSSKDSWILPGTYVAESRYKELYMGYFGLAAGPVSPGAGKDSVNPFLTTFASSGQIPSISYGYTAGASYNENGADDITENSGNGAVGNLVLGGYDDTRVNMKKGVSIGMPSIQNNSLVVGVPSIIYNPDPYVDAGSFSFTSETKGFSAIIDSTLPYLWLPDKVCDHFAEKFNLQYDEDSNFYTVNSSAAQNNKQQNATVSFKIASSSIDSSNFADIRLPYSAFDLTFTEPPNGNGTKYFPLKKSSDGSFVLGRAFLQEAYLVVDYERVNFTVAPAIAPALPMPDPKLVPIYNKTYVPPGPTPIPTSGGGGGLSGGAIAGIVVGIVVAFLGAAVGFFLWWKKRRAAQNAPPNYKEATEIDTSAAGNEVKHRRVSELDSEPPGFPKPTAPGGFYGDRGDRKDLSPFPPISEMDSPPAELYSPPAVASTPHSEGHGLDYFTTGGKLGRRGATRESSANNTPGTPPPFTPIAELPGDDGRFPVGGMRFDPIPSPKASPTLKSSALHNRGPSEAGSSRNNIDEVMKRPSAEPSPSRPEKTEAVTQSDASEDKKLEKEGNTEVEGETGEALERRPSHTRGLSDTTVQSDTTVVSQPTPEELERWALAEDEQPGRPLSE
ncbi:hypothetical protein N0V90_004953 [Kalmusia sp. IMI 367209]|nr:hypothetical protein N0V90_004953 [Kalmusia sp. IMI 367209]